MDSGNAIQPTTDPWAGNSYGLLDFLSAEAGDSLWEKSRFPTPAHVQGCGRIVRESPLDDLRPQKSEVCLKRQACLRTRKVPREVPAATHTLTQPLPAAARRGHRPLPSLSTSSGLMWPQAGAQGVVIGLGIFWPWCSAPGAVLQPSGSAVRWGLGIDLAHLPRNPGTRVPEHLCLQRDRD